MNAPLVAVGGRAFLHFLRFLAPTTQSALARAVHMLRTGTVRRMHARHRVCAWCGAARIVHVRAMMIAYITSHHRLPPGKMTIEPMDPSEPWPHTPHACCTSAPCTSCSFPAAPDSSEVSPRTSPLGSPVTSAGCHAPSNQPSAHATSWSFCRLHVVSRRWCFAMHGRTPVVSFPAHIHAPAAGAGLGRFCVIVGLSRSISRLPRWAEAT